jgi:hypothetical protein
MMTDSKIKAAPPQQTQTETAVAEFIRDKGITRCPTACVLPTQGEVAESDRAELAAYAIERERARQARAAHRARLYGTTEPSCADPQ